MTADWQVAGPIFGTHNLPKMRLVYIVSSETIYNYIFQVDLHTLYSGICEYDDSYFLSPNYFSNNGKKKVEELRGNVEALKWIRVDILESHCLTWKKEVGNEVIPSS